MLQDFLSLIYPRNCVACGNSLFRHEDQVCNYCYSNLPKTNFHKQSRNPVDALFYGRTPLLSASSFYLFQKKGSIQKILHAIKYKHNKDLAVLVGKWYAEDLKEDPVFSKTDFVIPVPLHSKKFKMRGYNQSEEFARGLSEGMKTNLNTSVLKRKEFTETQTKKSKYERWENVEDVFELVVPETFKNKHVVLVDDVITTGATIEACCQLLHQIEGIQISVLSIAYADK
ncbi:MAG: amidophosphoribosyltransferase [Bacteroidetes bacterium]|nr:amidophosphoribosyltransferase [Bacteroidota bacterium]MDF2452392.1 amidophosphoribosyltransferase [Bacteroidota bacterium]